MKPQLWRAATACVATALVMSLAVPAANATTPTVDPSADANLAPGDTLVDRVVEAAKSGQDSPDELAERLALPESGAGSLLMDDQERLTLMVMFAGAPSEATLDSIRALGELQSVQASFLTATAVVAPSRVAALQELPGVLTVVPALKPAAGGFAAEGGARLEADLASALPALRPAAARPDGSFCGPVPIEADAPLRADTARDTFGVDGSGVTIGIISDSFDHSDSAPIDAATDVRTGALPGPENPCGRLEPVTVLRDNPGKASDEGRAMTQLVHGIAPGAKLLFSTSGVHEGEFAEAVEKLAAAGADIIVDDVNMSTELTYQMGGLSQTIMKVRAQGVAYFNSAGNSTAVDAEGKPVASWRTSGYRAAACPDWVVRDDQDPLYGKAFDCLDFDPNQDDTVVTPYDTLQLQEAADPTITKPIDLSVWGSIGEPFAGVTTDFEWRFYEHDADTDTNTMLGNSITRLSPYHPNFAGLVQTKPGAELRMVMVRKSFDPQQPAPAVSTLFVRGGAWIGARQHMGNGTTDIVGPSAYGHSADGSAISVGSLHWDEPTKMRDFSSIGPGVTLFEPIDISVNSAADLRPSPPLPEPLSIDIPHIVAVDGTQTSFFYENDGTPEAPVYRFMGTSAAAPNAAAVAALAKSYAPGLTGEELRQLIMSTAAQDVVNPYAPTVSDRNVFGAGRVDATALLSALPERPAPVTLKLDKATKDQLEVSWAGSPVTRSLPGTADHYVIELYRGSVEPANVVEASQVEATASAHTFSGLTANTAYIVRLTPFAAQGVRGTPVELTASTLADSSGGDNGSQGGTPSGGKSATNTLSRTGAPDYTLWFVGGAAVLLLGAGLAVAGMRRRKRAGETVDVSNEAN